MPTTTNRILMGVGHGKGGVRRVGKGRHGQGDVSDVWGLNSSLRAGLLSWRFVEDSRESRPPDTGHKLKCVHAHLHACFSSLQKLFTPPSPISPTPYLLTLVTTMSVSMNFLVCLFRLHV